MLRIGILLPWVVPFATSPQVLTGQTDEGGSGSKGEFAELAVWPLIDQPTEIASGQVARLGSDDFSIAMWMNSDDDSDYVSGDLISHYDPVLRRGLHVTLKSNPGVTSNQANFRHLQFGIDDDRHSEWQDWGRPGNALLAFSMAVHSDTLFVGTCEPDAMDSGRVYRLGPDRRWIDCGGLDGANSVTAMAVYNNSLYVGTGKYRLAGSALPESGNPTLGGRVFRYEGDHQWQDCGQLPDVEAVGGMVVYGGRLYASSLYRPAGFFCYHGDRRWNSLPVPIVPAEETSPADSDQPAIHSHPRRVVSLTVFEGFLYATSYDCGHVYRFDGDRWTDCGQVGDNTQTYAFTSYQGKLHVATWPSGRVFRFDQIGQWTDMGRLGEEQEVMGMIVHNGRLLAGTLPSAQVYALEQHNRWSLLGQLDETPEVRYRRVWTAAEHDGHAVFSTLPSGRIFARRQGHQVDWGHSLPPGWQHVAVVKSSSQLSLWLNGKEVSVSAMHDGCDLDVSSSAVWRLGNGMNGPFNGRLRDIRLYRGSLPSQEILRLASQKPPT